MSLNRYYREELSFLREDFGPDFARANPAIASLLASPSSDPDVERLIEGFAFLTGNIRQKLDDEYPELVQALASILCPQFLKAIPSASIVQFEPLPNRLTAVRTVPKGTEVQSNYVDSTACTFRTCFDVSILPFALTDVSSDAAGVRLAFRFSISAGVSLAELNSIKIRLYITGENALDLYRALSGTGCRCWFIDSSSGERLTAPLPSPSSGGFGLSEALTPFADRSFEGYRLLQEYLVFPEKFMFIDLRCGAALRSASGMEFAIECEFEEPLSRTWRPSKESFRLNCVPAVNLFEDESEPTDITHEKTEYRIMPTRSDAEIYTVLGARAWVAGTSEPRRYEPFLSLDRASGVTYYTIRNRTGVNEEDRRTYLSLMRMQDDLPEPLRETAVFNLLCTNGVTASKLRVGDITRATDTSPEFARFRNVSRVSAYVPSSDAAERSWQLLSHLAISPGTLGNVTAFRSMLQLYNPPESADAPLVRANRSRIAGVTSIRMSSRDFIVTRDLDRDGNFKGRYGIPIRGSSVHLDIQGSNFAGEGDVFLFGAVMNHFLPQYSTMNSVTALQLKNLTSGAEYSWLPRLGEELVL